LSEGSVLDGEILAWKDERPAPFNLLQQRIVQRREVERPSGAAGRRQAVSDLTA
jgi:DNA ligase-1